VEAQGARGQLDGLGTQLVEQVSLLADGPKV
jgi:hypothetical protein